MRYSVLTAAGKVLGAIVGAAWFDRGTWRERYIDDDSIADVSGAYPVGED